MGKSLISTVVISPVNQFHANLIKREDIIVRPGGKRIRVIKAIDGQLVTGELSVDARIENNEVRTDPENDILKIVVVNRYFQAPPAIGFIHGFGLKSGAIASSVAHDSHNLIAVGTDDGSIVEATNAIIRSKGGVSLACKDKLSVLPLPVAGIMSVEDGYKVAQHYQILDEFVKTKMKSSLQAPFMTLSFMALLVIPTLKISDRGLFDGMTFSFTDLFEK